MGHYQEPHNPADSHASNDTRNSTLEAVTRYRFDELGRYRRRIISLIFVGLLISILVHLNIGFLLSLMTREGGGATPAGAFTTIEFAIQDSETFTDLPESEMEFQQDAAKTDATYETTDTTLAVLEADQEATPLQSSLGVATPSLSGGGSSGMGAGLGGSGGGGTSFFGISSTGTRFCYIVDVSGSMRNANRLESALEELTKSLKKLPDFARFYILFYSSRVQEPSIQQGWNTARASMVRRMVRDFQSIKPGGGTQPEPAFIRAFELNPLPEVIYFMTDGEISRFSLDRLREMLPQKNRVIINTIAFGDNSSQQLLRDIAKLTGGKFTFIQSGGSP